MAPGQCAGLTLIGSGFPITRNGTARFNSNSNGSITANEDFTITGDLIWSSNSNNASIETNGLFVIEGDLELESNAGSSIVIDIGSGGILIVQGDLVVTNGALNGVEVTSEGTLIVGGDFDLGNGSNINNNGKMYSGSTSGGASISGDPVGSLNDLLADDPTLCGLTATCTVALPVTLVSFDAGLSDNGVELNWATATEENNEYFTLERSVDGRLFETIATVEGIGNSISEIQYSHFDPVIADFNGFIYYRLSQTDYDRTSETFDLVAVRIEAIAADPMVYPNPSLTASMVNLKGMPSNSSWSIFSLSGEEIKKGKLDETFEISTWGMQPGSYLLKVEELGNNTEQFILIVQD
ncbi:MAG: T9SS type A sorting domain-containing protein [Bacteroidota bacterium]